MSGHTPGPWSYRSQPHDDWGVVRAGRYWICQAKDPNVYTEDQLAAHRKTKTDPWEANARLIAAAPDLLEALVRAQGFIRNGIDLGFIRMPDADCPDPAHEVPALIDAAISKARGEA